MLMKLRILLGIVLSLFLVSCKHKPDEEVTPCNKKDIRYKADIKPIIARNCAGCHHAYLVYDNLNELCINGKFYKRVLYLHNMPPTEMSTCDLNILRAWYYNGHTSY